jgi:hypothetical protein
MGDRRVDGHSAGFSDGGIEDTTQNDRPLSADLVNVVAEAHDVSETRLADVLSETVYRRVLELSEETTLDVQESIVYALFEDDSLSQQAISERLDIGPKVVQSSLERSRVKLEAARRTVSMVDTPSPLSVQEKDYTAEDWLGLEWTPWFELEDTHKLGELPTTAGLYRVRHTATDEIVYIGESGGKNGVLGRCRSLSSGVYDEAMPSKGSHPTRQRLWSLCQRDGGIVRVVSRNTTSCVPRSD